MSRIYSAVCVILLLHVHAAASSGALFETFATGSAPGFGGPVVFKILFDPEVKDSGVVSIVVHDPAIAPSRFDNIDFVPNSNFDRVTVTTQDAGNGSVAHYNVRSGGVLSNFVTSTSSVGLASPPSGMSRPASIVPNDAGTHLYYVENQFGFDGASHRIMRVTNATPGTVDTVFDGAASSLVEFSGVEITAGRLYFFARDETAATPYERGLYSVALGAGGLAMGAPMLEVSGLSRGNTLAVGPGPFTSDGADEIDFDPTTGLIYGTNIVSGEVIGFSPGSGPVTTAGLPFFISPGDVSGGDPDGLGLLAGSNQIDGIRPDGNGHLIVIGHAGVLASIDIAGVLADGADDIDITRLFDRDFVGAGITIGFDRAGMEFDDHTLVIPARIPEPATVLIAALGLLLLTAARRRQTRQ